MSKFDYMEFGYSAGSYDMLVFHAKKYSKEEAVSIFNEEYDYLDKVAKVEDIHDGYVKWFINPTESMSGDFEGGCYGFVDKPGNGAFPVYTLELSELDDFDEIEDGKTDYQRDCERTGY